MNKIPKELTPELLSLVIPNIFSDVKIIAINEIKNNKLYYDISSLGGKSEEEINLDTLSRLMEEFINKYYWIAEGITTNNFQISLTTIGKKIFSEQVFRDETSPTKLESITKATHWVAKEKGYIK